MHGSEINDSVTTLKSYIYIDEAEISGLYNQLYPNILEKMTSYEHKTNKSFDGTVGGSFFGAVNADGNIEHRSDNSFISGTKSNIPIERKANIIVSHVSDNRLLPLQTIIESSEKSNSMIRSRIICGYATFAITFIYDGDNHMIDLSVIPNNIDVKQFTFILESGHTHNIEELRATAGSDYYELHYQDNCKYGIEMHIGGHKMRREIRHLTYKIKKGKSFDFFILGHISYAGNKFYTIKPFAIW